VASLIYLDTHVLAWLYAGGGAALPSAPARRLEEAAEIRISPMVRLELQYLYEIGRVREPALPVLDALESALGLVVCSAPFSLVVREAEKLDWTRDPFDRLIVAQASVHEAPLLTRDGMIHEHYPHAVWD
jgi:PIN domain nuclease of toxin-antitoxin system